MTFKSILDVQTASCNERADAVIACLDGSTVRVLSGHLRLQAQIETFGEATVQLPGTGSAIRVCMLNGKLVEVE